jgi:hypothetical protein
MDAFNLIQNFFTKMRCNFCSHSFEPDDIQLIRQDEAIYIVNVFCNHCNTQNGVAMVGVEVPGQPGFTFDDPELTEEELVRLADYQPISPDDVLDAHHFFQGLDSDWMKFIPQEMLELQTELDTESEDD